MRREMTDAGSPQSVGDEMSSTRSAKAARTTRSIVERGETATFRSMRLPLLLVLAVLMVAPGAAQAQETMIVDGPIAVELVRFLDDFGQVYEGLVTEEAVQVGRHLTLGEPIVCHGSGDRLGPDITVDRYGCESGPVIVVGLDGFRLYDLLIRLNRRSDHLIFDEGAAGTLYLTLPMLRCTELIGPVIGLDGEPIPADDPRRVSCVAANVQRPIR